MSVLLTVVSEGNDSIAAYLENVSISQFIADVNELAAAKADQHVIKSAIVELSKLVK